MPDLHSPWCSLSPSLSLPLTLMMGKHNFCVITLTASPSLDSCGGAYKQLQYVAPRVPQYSLWTSPTHNLNTHHIAISQTY